VIAVGSAFVRRVLTMDFLRGGRRQAGRNPLTSFFLPFVVMTLRFVLA